MIIETIFLVIHCLPYGVIWILCDYLDAGKESLNAN